MRDRIGKYLSAGLILLHLVTAVFLSAHRHALALPSSPDTIQSSDDSEAAGASTKLRCIDHCSICQRGVVSFIEPASLPERDTPQRRIVEPVFFPLKNAEARSDESKRGPPSIPL